MGIPVHFSAEEGVVDVDREPGKLRESKAVPLTFDPYGVLSCRESIQDLRLLCPSCTGFDQLQYRRNDHEVRHNMSAVATLSDFWIHGLISGIKSLRVPVTRRRNCRLQSQSAGRFGDVLAVSTTDNLKEWSQAAPALSDARKFLILWLRFGRRRRPTPGDVVRPQSRSQLRRLLPRSWLAEVMATHLPQR
jgi:hypothetical protein